MPRWVAPVLPFGCVSRSALQRPGVLLNLHTMLGSVLCVVRGATLSVHVVPACTFGSFSATFSSSRYHDLPFK